MRKKDRKSTFEEEANNNNGGAQRAAGRGGLVTSEGKSPDAGRQAGCGGGPSGPGLLPGGSAAAAGLCESAPVRSCSRSVAVSAPARLHNRDPAQTLPCPPAGPPTPAGG